MAKKIAIIGAGVSGLAAGCYGQMNGYETNIFEMHNQSGGVCTSWKRDGYTIDGCIHWLIGTSPDHNLYKLYEELGITQGTQFVFSEELKRIEGDGGKVFVVYTDADKLEQQMKELSPQDTVAIEEFTSLVKRFYDFNPPPELVAGGGVSLKGATALIHMFPFLRSMSKYGKVSMVQFAVKFKDPFLRESFLKILEIPQMSVMSAVLLLGMMGSKKAGYPIGGSLKLAETVEKRYRSLGGDIHYNSKVEKIIVEGNQAIGIRLVNGQELKADFVVSAADGRSTIFGMLNGKYVDDKTRRYYNEMPTFDPLIQVALGVALDMSKEPSHLIFKTKSPLRIGGATTSTVGCTNYSFDPTLAPAGKTVLITIYLADYHYWRLLSNNRQQYEAEKQRIAKETIVALTARFPDLADKVEVIDVATPVTYERYTGNYQGAYEGWLPTTENYGETLNSTLPGLKNFYHIGQWTIPGGGVPIGVATGRKVISAICKQEKKPFTTVTP